MNSFDLERAIAAWRQRFAQRRAFLREDLDELERHLRDHLAHLRAEGYPPETAFRRAVHAVGTSWEAEDEYRKVYWNKIKRKGRRVSELLWRLAMLKNYLKTAFRSLKRRKSYTLINVVGLAVGIACTIMILLWVLDELSYDRFHEKAERLYRVEEDQNYSGRTFRVVVTPPAAAPAFEADVPEVVRATRYMGTGNLLLRVGETSFPEDGVKIVDPAFLSMFSFPLVAGDPATALATPKSLVLSETTAQKYFRDEDPMGQTVTINDQYELTVTGVLHDVPVNSSLQFDLLLSTEFLISLGNQLDNWGGNSLQTYVELTPNQPVGPVNRKLTDLLHANLDTDTELVLRPVTDIHLHTYIGFEQEAGAVKYVYIFSVIALFVLLIACINFTNLVTARSADRAQEIGMRKAVGARRAHIALQFLGESLFLAVVAVLLGIGLVVLLLDPFNTLAGKDITLAALGRWDFVLGVLGVVVLTGLIAGSYPALFLSSFRPSQVLKGGRASGMKRSLLRRVLVVTQFGLSIFLIIGTGIVYQQLHYMKNKNLGFEKDHLLYMGLRSELREAYPTLREEWERHPSIASVTASRMRPTLIGSNAGGASWEGKDPEQDVLIGYSAVDYDYVETLQIELVEGRSFSRDYPSDVTTDSMSAFIVNEEVADLMDKESVVGEQFSFLGRAGHIVGVMKNFHFLPLQTEIGPLALYLHPPSANYAIVRVKPGNMEASLAYLRSTWEEVVPDYPFEYRFLDEDVDASVQSEARLGKLAGIFSGLAVLIACLGLLGLAAFTAETRTKEIGIRKVLGASVPGLIALLSKDFLKLVAVAFILAAPLAYLVMQRWLDDFAYRIDIPWWIFLLAGLAALGIALLTVSGQALRAALTDPIKSLRYE